MLKLVTCRIDALLFEQLMIVELQRGLLLLIYQKWCSLRLRVDRIVEKGIFVSLREFLTTEGLCWWFIHLRVLGLEELFGCLRLLGTGSCCLGIGQL